MATAPDYANDDEDVTTEAERDSDRLKAVHKRAMQRFDDCAFPTQEQRASSLAARRFVSIPGAQWDGDWGEQFANSIKVEVDKVGRGLRKIETDYRQNRIVPEFRPDGEKADEETAETLAGIHRADSYRFKSQQARDNAAYEAFAGGYGAYRLSNEWEDESDRDNDHQRINPASIIVDADQSVFFDINAVLYDKSDAKYCFVRVALAKEAFETEYGEFQTEFPEGTNWRMRDWFRAETVAIAEYYEKEEVSEALYIATYPLSGVEERYWASELDAGQLKQMRDDGWRIRRQNRKRCRVHKYVISGADVLEDKGLIAGPNIPIVPVYGRRYFVDGIEWWQGYVQPKMDSQRVYNSKVSKLAEIDARAPAELPIFAPEQMPPAIADMWARQNIDRHAYALAEIIRDANGDPVQMGPLGYTKVPDVPQVTATLLQIANQDLLEDTEDGADTVKANTSAEAMDIAANRVDAKSGIYLDNFAQSVQREGEIYFGMAAEVYHEDRRQIDTMDEDGNDGQAVLKQPGEGGALVNDFAAARYKVIASVTEATATRRDKTVRSSINLAETATQAGDMELASAALLTAVMNQDGEGMDNLQDYARKRLVDMGVVPPSDDEKQQMDEAAQNQQPDPTANALNAQAEDFQASAREKATQAIKNLADAKLRGAQFIETMASAGAKHAAAGKTRAEVVPLRLPAPHPGLNPS